MNIERIGYGAGHRDLVEQANLLRIFVGTDGVEVGHDEVTVLETNIDDATVSSWGLPSSDYGTPVRWRSVYHGRRHEEESSRCAADSALSASVSRTHRGFDLYAHRFAGDSTSTDDASQAASRSHSRRDAAGRSPRQTGLALGRDPNVAPEFEDCKRFALESGMPLAQVYQLVAAA